MSNRNRGAATPKSIDFDFDIPPLPNQWKNRQHTERGKGGRGSAVNKELEANDRGWGDKMTVQRPEPENVKRALNAIDKRSADLGRSTPAKTEPENATNGEVSKHGPSPRSFRKGFHVVRCIRGEWNRTKI